MQTKPQWHYNAISTQVERNIKIENWKARLWRNIQWRQINPEINWRFVWCYKHKIIEYDDLKSVEF